MPSKSTYISGGLLGVVTVTQAFAGDWPTAIMSGVALGTGAVGYMRDKSFIGRLLD